MNVKRKLCHDDEHPIDYPEIVAAMTSACLEAPASQVQTKANTRGSYPVLIEQSKGRVLAGVPAPEVRSLGEPILLMMSHHTPASLHV